MESSLNPDEWKAYPCWIWPFAKDKDGYGRVYMHGNRRAHRLAYKSFVGKIPTGLCVLHRCDVPSCVNPRHLFLGTVKDNNRDRVFKGRNGKRPGHPPRPACAKGHPFDSVNTGWYTSGYDGKTKRYCRTCHRDYWRNRSRFYNQTKTVDNGAGIAR